MPDTQPTPDPTPQPKPIIQRKYIIVAAVALVVLLTGIVTLLFAAGDSNNNRADNTIPPKTPYKTYIKPTAATLKVGDRRYVTPCRALPAAYVDKNFGFADETTLQETTISASIPKTAMETDDDCSYLINSKTLRDVTLRTKQYPNPTDTKRIGSIVFATPDQVQADINTLKQATAKSTNKEVKAFITQLEKSLASYSTYKREYDPKKLESFKPDGFIMRSLTNEYTTIYGNVVYQLSINYIKGSAPSAEKQLLGFSKAFAEIKKNAQNSNLSQVPGPTVLGGKQTVGSTTKVLEPCVVLGADTFKEITGLDQNASLSRSTLPANPGKDRYGKVDKQLIIPSNACERSNENADGTHKTEVDLSIRHAKSEAQAKDWFTKFATGEGDVRLQTSADEAVASANEFDPGKYIYGFRVGPYIAILDISTVDSPGGKTTITPASQDLHIATINLLAKRMR